MAKQFDDTNTGIIGVNDYKQKDTHPDQRGRANIGGIWYWVSGWDKTAGGRNFTSLAFTEMTQDEADKVIQKQAEKQRPQQGSQQRQQQAGSQQQSQQKQQQTQQQSTQSSGSNEPPMDFDDDIPF